MSCLGVVARTRTRSGSGAIVTVIVSLIVAPLRDVGGSTSESRASTGAWTVADEGNFPVAGSPWAPPTALAVSARVIAVVGAALVALAVSPPRARDDDPAR
jgi:hypothetical protein